MFFDTAGQIIMWNMKFPIDVLFLDNQFKITTLKSDVQPATQNDTQGWNSAEPTPNSQFVLELPQGHISLYNLKVGSSLSFFVEKPKTASTHT